MADIHEGRNTVVVQGDFVVFVIGARVGNPVRAVKAIPMLAKMPAMLKELSEDPSSGLLGFQTYGPPIWGVIVQYWRSFEALEAYAKNPDAKHAKVWKDWYQLGQHKNGSAGIWHETYKIHAGEYEAIYQNMPAIGLMKAGAVEPVGSRSETARKRIGAD